MNKKRRTTLQRCAVVTAITVSTAVGMAQSRPELIARVAGSNVTLSFDLHPERTDDLARRLATNSPVSVIWIVEARQRVRLWRDRHVKRAVIRLIATRAGGSDVFTITRAVDGQQGPAVRATLADSYRYLTSFDLLPLFSTAELSAQDGYRFEIRAILDGGTEPKIETAVLAEGSLVP